MLVRHMDIRIFACDFGKLCPGDRIHTYGTGYLRHVGVVAGLIQAPHAVKQGDNLHQLVCRTRRPINPDEPYPAVGRYGLQDSFAIDCRADVFQPQSRYARI